MAKVGICGHFGIGHELLNGQTVKTNQITEELLKLYGKKNIITIDTHNWKKNPVLLVINCLNILSKCENIVIMPAQRGVKIFIPLFLIFNIIFRRKIHYIVIGGWLPSLLKTNRLLRYLIFKIDGVYVETEHVLNSLNLLGLSNIRILKNFKNLKILNKKGLKQSYHEPFRLCTFSRVMKEKGIEDAIKVVTDLNRSFGRTVYTLDIYGQIDINYINEFTLIMKEFPSFIRYKGSVNFDESVDILKDYFVLLFPTRFITEGIPGTILDAYAAGLPVIASEWESARELVTDSKTGFIYEFENLEQFKNILSNLINNAELVMNMKEHCLKKAREYSSKKVIKDFSKFL